jgi:hypothetical protein
MEVNQLIKPQPAPIPREGEEARKHAAVVVVSRLFLSSLIYTRDREPAGGRKRPSARARIVGAITNLHIHAAAAAAIMIG